MPDFTPMGAAGNPVNPQPFQSLSGILGIAQQAQALKTSAAQTIQAKQQARETQAAAQLLSDPVGNGILEADGKTPTSDAQSIIMRAAPTTGAARYDQIVKAAQSKVEFENAKNNLNLNERQAFNAAVAGTAAGAQSPQDLKDGVDQFLTAVKGSPVEKDYQTLAKTFNEGLDHVATKETPPGQPEPWRQFGLQYGRAVLGAPGTVGAGGISLPQGTTNAAGQIVNRDPLTGQLSPAPVATGGGGLGLNPATPRVAAATGAATGQVDVDNQRFNSISQAAAKGQTGVALADQVADLAKQVRTGQLSKEWSDKLTILKQSDPSITARQMLSKYAAQLKTTAESGAATDAERSQIDAGMPSPETMNPEAVRDAAQYLHGYFRMNQARGQNAMNHVAANGTTGLTQKDTAFMQQADPFVYAFRDMPTADKKEFLLKRYGPGGSKDPEGFAAFERRVKGNAGP